MENKLETFKNAMKERGLTVELTDENKRVRVYNCNAIPRPKSIYYDFVEDICKLKVENAIVNCLFVLSMHAQGKLAESVNSLPV